MARQVSGTVHVIVHLEEVETDAGLASQNARVSHDYEKKFEWTAGNDAVTKLDRIMSSDAGFTTSPTDLDLVGTSITSALSSTVTFAGGVAVVLVTNEGTAGGTVSVGAGSAPWDDWVIAAGDGVKIPQGGLLLWIAPETDEAPTATTADILRIVGSATIAGKSLIAGRST
jgi:hypothetical protein